MTGSTRHIAGSNLFSIDFVILPARKLLQYDAAAFSTQVIVGRSVRILIFCFVLLKIQVYNTQSKSNLKHVIRQPRSRGLSSRPVERNGGKRDPGDEVGDRAFLFPDQFEEMKTV